MKKSNRVWLNPEKTQLAFMAWSVDATGPEVDATVEFGDCNRRVNLEFNSYAREIGARRVMIKKRLRKLTMIQNELAAFRNALEECLK